jgi:hypothetical protein
MNSEGANNGDILDMAGLQMWCLWIQPNMLVGLAHAWQVLNTFFKCT